ncbi:hypothetical protein [Streptomyces marianii]|uniref:Uncharacterized protein n=1 Tax=Streptomyces marianii TaxID=1817406 RepID=A0A5R9E6P4_9ACTN|nr:hypothetical protein [Streptomyces marianii]TLQ45678.1 hypothetical protein FEF34_24155 [Streptomyces marianii]
MAPHRNGSGAVRGPAGGVSPTRPWAANRPVGNGVFDGGGRAYAGPRTAGKAGAWPAVFTAAGGMALVSWAVTRRAG